jgi:hypothetical protein
VLHDCHVGDIDTQPSLGRIFADPHALKFNSRKSFHPAMRQVVREIKGRFELAS